MRSLSGLPVFIVATLVASAAASCKSVVVTPDECTKVADYLGKLQVKKEKLPPMGRLAAAPFNGPDNERAVFEEARDSAKTRCLKGWKREMTECMLAADTIENADKCRLQ